MSNLVVHWIKTIVRSVYPGANETGPALPAGRRPEDILRPFALQFGAIAEVVRVPKPEEVQRYFSEYPGFQETVRPLCEAVRREFGPEAELSLELYGDPEIDDHHLTLYVRENNYPAGFMARVDRAIEPFQEELCRQSGWLLVTTDFRAPRAKNAI